MFHHQFASNGKISLTSGTLLDKPTEHRSIVGGLQYLTLTQPDIAFVVNQVCQYMHAPTTTHLIAVKRSLRFFFFFLKGTVSFGIHLRPSLLRLIAYCNADWASQPHDQRSTNGYCVYFGPNPITWCAKKQTTVARSSTEAKYHCLAHTAVEVSWLCMLLGDLQFFYGTSQSFAVMIHFACL